MKLRTLSLPFAFMLAFCAAAGVPIVNAAAQQETAADQPIETAQAPQSEGAQTCLRCHDEPPATLILHSAHAVRGDARTPFANGDCQACHGESQAHLRKPPEGQERAEPDIVFGMKSPTPAATQNGVCIGCHEGGLRMNWPMSEHSTNDVACASCHNTHAVKDRVLVKQTQPDICFSCHAEQRAQSLKRSHHPIREGKVVCAECHNPHGSFGPKMLVKNSVNDTCFSCHAEKRGPFLWEHAPVSDNCSNCHTPHGSSQPRLLKVRTPMLCQQCHSETRHPSSVYGGQDLPPNPLSNSSARLVAKGCLNCHPQIHGTNHPSGPRFTR